ncbi:MAG: unnamed protein product [Candidatus Burkholderia crenata]|nr:MAG: unnamed protein product [Candidatus Burkholderia crenata]
MFLLDIVDRWQRRHSHDRRVGVVIRNWRNGIVNGIVDSNKVLPPPKTRAAFAGPQIQAAATATAASDKQEFRRFTTFLPTWFDNTLPDFFTASRYWTALLESKLHELQREQRAPPVNARLTDIDDPF